MPQILDQFGQPIDTGALRRQQTQDLPNVRSLYNELDEHPARGLSPRRIHDIMREAEEGDWTRQIEVADDMEERDTQIYSEVAKRKNAVVKLDWDIVAPENATPQEEKLAETVKEFVRGIPSFKRNIVFNIMDGVLKGFAAVEMWWTLRDGQLLPSFEYRPQRFFCLDQYRHHINLRDAATPYGVPLRPYNWLLHKHPARSGYPARQSLARVLMFPYLYKIYALRDLAEFLEIYGLPLRLGKYPGGSGDAEKAALLRAVADIGHNAAGIIPLGMEIEFQNAAQGTQVPFEAMLDRMDSAISKAVVGQTLTSSEGKNGTQALGNVHNDVRLDILAADAELISETLTQQLIAPLCLLNIAGANPRRLPRFVLEVPEPEDILAMADALPKLASAGMEIGERWARRKLRIPDLDLGEMSLGAAPAPAPVPQPAALPAMPANTKDKPAADTAPAANLHTLQHLLTSLQAAQAAPPRDALDALVDQAADNWQPTLAPLVQPLLRELESAIARNESAESFSARLPGLIALMNASALAERAALAGFNAHLAGAADLNLSA
jgi:phage gp29-like protein